eukprot:4691438-Pleurochrysis_carterae.AAC.1
MRFDINRHANCSQTRSQLVVNHPAMVSAWCKSSSDKYSGPGVAARLLFLLSYTTPVLFGVRRCLTKT